MEQKLKILHVVEAFGGGIIEFLVQLTQLDTLSHTIFYAERELSIDQIKHRFSPNIEFIEWSGAQREISPVKDIQSLIFLTRFLKRNKFDIVHLHSSKAGILGRIFGLFHAEIPIVYTPHGASFARADISKVKKIFYQSMEQIAAKLSGTVVCVSKSEAQIYQTLGIKAMYINNGVTINREYTKLYDEHKKINIVTIGRVTYQKNPALFNEIASHFVNDSNVYFTWIGGGDLENVLNSSNIKITGWLSKKGVEQELKNADIYLSTALWEGLPLAVLEAMNLHLPMVLKSCVGNIDLVNNENGICFKDTDDAIEHIKHLISNKKQMMTEGQASFAFLIDNFDVEKMKNNYETLYYTLIKKPQ